MELDVLNFIPSPDVREECKRIGKTFSTREKIAVVFWSDRPMKDRTDAYEIIGREDSEHQKKLLPIITWMRNTLGSFPKTEDGYVFFSGKRSVFTGHLDSCVHTTFSSALKRCQECYNTEGKIVITKAAVDRDYYQTAFLSLDGIINHICIFDSRHQNGYDPEKKLNPPHPNIPCPFKKGDSVCFWFDPENPMVFLEQEEQMCFKYIGEDFLTGRLSKGLSCPCAQLMYFKHELPHGELQVAQKAVRGEIEFIDAVNLIQSCRNEAELIDLDEQSDVCTTEDRDESH